MNFRYKNSAIAMASFYDLAAKRLDGEMIKMEQYRSKVVLVENTASLWGTTVRDFTQMNELCEKVWWNDSINPYSVNNDDIDIELFQFSDKLAVLAFPTNQVGNVGI